MDADERRRRMAACRPGSECGLRSCGLCSTFLASFNEGDS